jgi:hypothetical protein
MVPGEVFSIVTCADSPRTTAAAQRMQEGIETDDKGFPVFPPGRTARTRDDEPGR